MAIFLLGPDQDGNCCSCNERISPCDSCAPASGCICALQPPLTTNVGGLFQTYEIAELGMSSYVANCMVYYGPYDLYNTFGGSPPSVPSVFEASLDINNNLTFSLSSTYAGQTFLGFSISCSDASVLSINFNCSSDGSPPPEEGRFVFAILWDCNYKTNGIEIDRWDGAYEELVGTATLNIPSAGTYTVWFSFSSYANSTSVNIDFSTSQSEGVTQVVNPVIGQWNDSDITRPLEACPKLLMPIGTELDGSWYVDEAAAQDEINDKTSNCVGYFFVSSEDDPNVSSTFTATDNTTSVTIDTEVIGDNTSGGLSSLDTQCIVSLNSEEGATIDIDGLWEYSSDVGCATVMKIYFNIYDYNFELVESVEYGSISNVLSNPNSLSISWSSNPLPYFGKYILEIRTSPFPSSICSPAIHELILNATIGTSATTSINPIQALYSYDPFIDCPARLNC